MRVTFRRLLPIALATFATAVLVSLLSTLNAEQQDRWNDQAIIDSRHPILAKPIKEKNGIFEDRSIVEVKNGDFVDQKKQEKWPVDFGHAPALFPEKEIPKSDHKNHSQPPIARAQKSDRLKKLKQLSTASDQKKERGEQETEIRWKKDDEILVPNEPIDTDLPKKMILDQSIVDLRDKYHVDTYPEPDIACPNKTTLEEFYWKKYKKIWQKDDTWDLFFSQIGNCDMYRDNSQIVENLLQDMATMPIKSVANLDGGTQVKISLTFENGKHAVFKPMRFGRNYETDPNHFYFTDFERHHAEIAAFHLDRLLGFRRAIPTVGRVLNISSDLQARSDDVIKYFHSPAKNLCFVGKCDYYCDTTHAICGNPDLKEGSVQVWLPGDEIAQRDYWRSPYKRTYSKREQNAPWQTDHTFCTWKVKNTPPFTKGRRLLDIVDLYIFDFIAGNQDRHHYESFTFFDPVPHLSYIVHLDNGRAFGSPNFDDLDIIAPLTQCCMIRPSTAKTLLKFYLGPISLAQSLKESLKKDPLYPLLATKYLTAVDRRVEIVLREVAKCVQQANGDLKKVLINHFYNPDAPPDAKEFEDSDSNE